MTFQPRPAGFPALWLALGLTVLSLGGCNNENMRTGASGPRVFAADFAGGAKTCVVPKPTLKDGELTEVAMKVGNDGGWCGITVAQASGKPFDAGLLTARPEHGKVFIHAVGDATRIDYTPDRGFTGSDAFTVKLVPGNPSVRGVVTVTAP